MPRAWRIKLGDTLSLWTQEAQGATGIQTATIAHIDRHKLVIKLAGYDIILTR